MFKAIRMGAISQTNLSSSKSVNELLSKRTYQTQTEIIISNRIRICVISNLTINELKILDAYRNLGVFASYHYNS